MKLMNYGYEFLKYSVKIRSNTKKSFLTFRPTNFDHFNTVTMCRLCVNVILDWWDNLYTVTYCLYDIACNYCIGSHGEDCLSHLVHCFFKRQHLERYLKGTHIAFLYLCHLNHSYEVQARRKQLQMGGGGGGTHKFFGGHT